jgi:predicted dithiol-disulfide oxidoreductase (DUF899 family)
VHRGSGFKRFATSSAGFGANCRGVEVGNAYFFDAPHGEVTLAYLSDGRGQLDIKQFRLGPARLGHASSVPARSILSKVCSCISKTMT